MDDDSVAYMCALERGAREQEGGGAIDTRVTPGRTDSRGPTVSPGRRSQRGNGLPGADGSSWAQKRQRDEFEATLMEINTSYVLLDSNVKDCLGSGCLGSRRKLLKYGGQSVCMAEEPCPANQNECIADQLLTYLRTTI